MFVESPQQAVTGAIRAGFTGGTAEAFHLGRGYGFAPQEQKTTMRRKPDQTQEQKCVYVRVGGGRPGGALRKPKIKTEGHFMCCVS